MKLQTKHITVKSRLLNPITVATGQVRPLTNSETQSVLTTDYVGNHVFENGELKMTLFPGGYIRQMRTDRDFSCHSLYHYYSRDYQGNNRDVVVRDEEDGSQVTLQRTEYTPFGVSFPQTAGDAGVQPYKYSGKELDKMHGLNYYDFHKRFYDPLLASFLTIDPLCEKYYSISPYVYALNNPIRNIDLRGDSITVANDEASRNDIASIVDENNRDYITYDENDNMTLNFGDMTQKQINKLLRKDKGLNLLNNLINATSSDGTSQKFFYATTNERSGIDSRTGDAFNITLNREAGTVTINDNSFATSLSITPAGDNRVVLLPEAGYDGTVRISPGTMYDSYGVVPRKSLVYHELSENYLRTNQRMSQPVAHKKAGGIGNYTKFIWGK